MQYMMHTQNICTILVYTNTSKSRWGHNATERTSWRNVFSPPPPQPTHQVAWRRYVFSCFLPSPNIAGKKSYSTWWESPDGIFRFLHPHAEVPYRAWHSRVTVGWWTQRREKAPKAYSVFSTSMRRCLTERDTGLRSVGRPPLHTDKGFLNTQQNHLRIA